MNERETFLREKSFCIMHAKIPFTILDPKTLSEKSTENITRTKPWVDGQMNLHIYPLIWIKMVNKASLILQSTKPNSFGFSTVEESLDTSSQSKHNILNHNCWHPKAQICCIWRKNLNIVDFQKSYVILLYRLCLIHNGSVCGRQSRSA